MSLNSTFIGGPACSCSASTPCTARRPTPGNTFLVWKQGLVDDFDLRVTYRIEGGNSGIQYRSRELGNGPSEFVVGGYQADFEAGPTYSGILYEERGRGILAGRGERVRIAADGGKTKGEPLGVSADLQRAIRPAPSRTPG